MRAIIAGFLALAGTAVGAEDWIALSGEGIARALTDQIVTYESAWQEFRSTGRTLYNAGSDSWGYWRVQGEMYCSQWPPRAEWACYRVEAMGELVRFVGAGSGDITVGRIGKMAP